MLGLAALARWHPEHAHDPVDAGARSPDGPMAVGPGRAVDAPLGLAVLPPKGAAGLRFPNDDNALLSLAAAFEKTGSWRTEPPRTPRLPAQ
ncbi:hypothetical protein [Streptomyces sp. NPDC049906]|uniref:hypothetical protein n=1 Tax=Streptomyces sp. NPDC049906 TaxID=3155656 RepID=UPI00341670FF